MSSSLRRFGQLFGSAVLVSALAIACASSASDGGGEDLGIRFPDGGLTRVVVEGGNLKVGDGEPPPLTWNLNCGLVSRCGGAIPDDPQACAKFDGGGILLPPLPDGAPMGTGGASGFDAGADGSAAPLDASRPDGGGRVDAGRSDAAIGDAALGDAADAMLRDAGGSDSRADAAFDGVAVDAPIDPADASEPVYQPTGFPPAPAPDVGQAPEPVYACHVRRSVSDPTQIEHRCDLAGAADVGDACTSSRDCRPGLGCVGEENAGQCLPFCCASVATDGGRPAPVCDDGSFCAERPLRDDVGDNPLTVPVCAIADQCSLADPYPCPAGQECSCPEDKACAVVRVDGTTSCVTPGTKTAGDSCVAGAHDCAPGFFCANSMKTCVKICRTDRPGDCGSGKCQAAANLPDGFGLCAGMMTP